MVRSLLFEFATPLIRIVARTTLVWCYSISSLAFHFISVDVILNDYAFVLLYLIELDWRVEFYMAIPGIT
jgi:hypothetical protein